MSHAPRNPIGKDEIAALAASAALYPQNLDLLRDAVLLIRMREESYRQASFLDDRILGPATSGSWVPFAVLEEAVARQNAPVLPLHFIFHAGHVGSTLLSRLIEEAGGVIAPREPLPLRVLAEAHDVLDQPESLLSAEQFDARLALMLRLLARGFAGTRMAVVKATSTAARLAPVLLAARGDARAVYLNLAPEPYLATLLAGANAVLDLKGHGPERLRRLTRVTGEAPLALHAASPGELAAMSWLAERLTQDAVMRAFGPRVLALDFDSLLQDIEDAMRKVIAHFGIEAPQGYFAAVAQSPLLMRYSKAPEHAYSPALRGQILDQARSAHAAEIRKGLGWLETLAGKYAVVAAAF